MKKMYGYYYTTKQEGFIERGNSTPLKTYSWAIRNKDGEVLESSDINSLFNSRIDAELDAEDHIREYYS